MEVSNSSPHTEGVPGSQREGSEQQPPGQQGPATEGGQVGSLPGPHRVKQVYKDKCSPGRGVGAFRDREGAPTVPSRSCCSQPGDTRGAWDRVAEPGGHQTQEAASHRGTHPGAPLAGSPQSRQVHRSRKEGACGAGWGNGEGPFHGDKRFIWGRWEFWSRWQ